MKITKKELTAHKFLLISIILILLLNFVLTRFLFLPMERALVTLKDKSSVLNEEKARLAKDLAFLKIKEANLKDKESRLTEYFILKSKLVDFNVSSQFLKNIVSFSGVNVQSLKPLQKEQVGNFKKWQINLSFTGRYHDINNYFEYLGKLPYILSVKKVTLEKTSTPGINRANITIEAIGI